MTEFEQTLLNIPTDGSDPKILFGSLLSEHRGIVDSLKSLAIQNNRLVALLRDTYYINDEIYNWMSDQLNYLDLLSVTQPNLNQIPARIPKGDIKKAIVNLGKIDDADSNLTFLNISNEFGNEDDVDLKSLDIGIKEEFLQLMSPSVTNAIIGIAYDSDSADTIAAPTDIVMGIIGNIVEAKKSSLSYELDIHYENFIEPFLNYQYFLEGNKISAQVDRLFLIERFLLEENVFDIPLANISYSNSLLWSKYFERIFLFKGPSEIRFFKTDIPDLTSENSDDSETVMVLEFTRYFLSDLEFARRAHELVTRCNRLINYVGDKIDPDVVSRLFVGLDVSSD